MRAPAFAFYNMSAQGHMGFIGIADMTSVGLLHLLVTSFVKKLDKANFTEQG